MNLVKYDQNGLELWVDESTGLVYAHLRAIARMLGGRPHISTVSARLERLTNGMVNRAKLDTALGDRTCRLYPISAVFYLAVEFKPQLAAQLAALGFVSDEQWKYADALVVNKALKTPKHQSVYILQCSQTGVIKVGISSNPKQRLAAIQTGYPFLLKLERIIKTDDPRGVERQLHQALDDFRLKGEWFDGACLQVIGS